MEGYTEVDIPYKTAEKSFARDIVAQSDGIKAKELEELYKALEKLLVETDSEPARDAVLKENEEIMLQTGINYTGELSLDKFSELYQ